MPRCLWAVPTPLPRGGAQGRQASGPGVHPAGELQRPSAPRPCRPPPPAAVGRGVPGGAGSTCRLRAGEAPSGEKKPRAGARAAEAGSDHPSLSWAVVEVTGHAHVLLAAFEKVSPVLLLTALLTSLYCRVLHTVGAQ